MFGVTTAVLLKTESGNSVPKVTAVFAAEAVEVEAVVEAGDGCAWDARIAACAIMVERSGPPEMSCGEAFAGVVLELVSLLAPAGSLPVEGEGGVDASVCCALAAMIDTWANKVERSGTAGTDEDGFFAVVAAGPESFSGMGVFVAVGAVGAAALDAFEARTEA